MGKIMTVLGAAGAPFKVISGTVPPGLEVLPPYGSGTIVFGDVTHSGTFVLMGKATSPQGATAMTHAAVRRADRPRASRPPSNSASPSSREHRRQPSLPPRR